jgi:hypothetical protein
MAGEMREGCTKIWHLKAKMWGKVDYMGVEMNEDDINTV